MINAGKYTCAIPVPWIRYGSLHCFPQFFLEGETSQTFGKITNLEFWGREKRPLIHELISRLMVITLSLLLLMEEILYHLGCIKPRKKWDKLPIILSTG